MAAAGDVRLGWTDAAALQAAAGGLERRGIAVLDMPNAAAGCRLRWANMAAALGDVRLGWPDAAALRAAAVAGLSGGGLRRSSGLAAASISIGNWLEHDVVHSRCRRISFKRNGDDAPMVFGVRLADTRSGKRAETALSAQGAADGLERRGIAAVEWVGGGEYFY